MKRRAAPLGPVISRSRRNLYSFGGKAGIKTDESHASGALQREVSCLPRRGLWTLESLLSFGLWSVHFPPSSLGPVGFRISRGLYRGGVLVSMTGPSYPRNGAPGPGEAFKPSLPDVCVYYYRTYEKAVSGGGERDGYQREVWYRESGPSRVNFPWGTCDSKGPEGPLQLRYKGGTKADSHRCAWE